MSAGGNRNLADFESMTVDPTGNIELVIPADPTNVLPTDTHQTVNWYFKETSGPLMPPGATNGNGTGNQTYFAASLALPEAPLTALLVVPGLAVAAAFVARRRRRGVVLAQIRGLSPRGGAHPPVVTTSTVRSASRSSRG